VQRELPADWLLPLKALQAIFAPRVAELQLLMEDVLAE
jgi:hypothetical protein